MSFKLKPIIERQPVSHSVLHENPIINRVLQNRGIHNMDEMTYSLAGLIDPSSMLGMKEACEVLERHLRAGSRLVVVGDFDCDGATSTSIAVEGLKTLGFADVNFLIPDRVIHGYGLTPSIVKLAGELEPDLIVTVDNGIASLEGAEAIKALDRPCELLVTDHHLPGEKGLPHAAAIVNPNQTGCPFPSKALAGCGVMFYVIMALRAHLRGVGYFDEKGVGQPNIMPLIDLVALGTVADVVPLDRNNRILVDAGLKRIRAGLGRPGIRAILDVAKKDHSKLMASDFGFAVGPRINAAGRLEDMTQGINCLLSTDYDEALAMAQRLDDLNHQRRDIEADHVFDAANYIDSYNLRAKKGVVIHDPTWHPGVVGIVASRIKEKINRPIICMTDAASAQEQREVIFRLEASGASEMEIIKAKEQLQECEVKGSARSIEGVHLKHVLDHIAKQHPDILTKFGGHAMAAGLSLKYKNLPRFMECFDKEVAAIVTDEQLVGSVEVDIKNVDSAVMNIELAREFRSMGPWGQCFPEPIMHGTFIVLNTRVLKEKHLKMTVALESDPTKKLDAICFNCVENGELPIGDRFESAFVLDINEYPPGNEKLQLMLREVQDPTLAKQRVASAEKIKQSKQDEAARQMRIANTLQESLERHDPEPREARIQGVAKQKIDNPVSKMRDDLQAVIKSLKEQSLNTTKKLSDDSPSPF
jgi:single-stranded-DNA-specific exonuclease